MVNIKRHEEYVFSVDVIREGQPRKYADSEYEYEIMSELRENIVKKFCTNILHPNRQEYKDWDRNNAASYFHGYYTFQKIDEGRYRYYVKEPFCD
ncbi:MAG: hypothetical protein IJX08_03800 [Clostridia bacterium]|nr:hypothetical protein [Clostridia bacterium]